MNADRLEVTRQPVPEPAQLQAIWQELEGRSAPPVFLSWQWLGHWLAVYQPPAELLEVREGARVIGLGIVVATEERRHGVPHSHCLRLHQTGYRHQDQIWIEYNGFLAEQGRETDVAEACLRYLCDEMPDWDEFIIGAIDAGEAKFFAGMTGLHSHLRWEAPCFGVDLNALRSSGQHYLSTLSRNTRHQINRAHRLYESRGPLSLVRPDSAHEAVAVFDSIGPLHLHRWGDGPDQSGYANPDFVRFHRSLIEDQWASGGVDLVSLKAGDEVIASFYNLLYDQNVYFYLGGMKTEDDNRLKPGLLGHSLCIEDYRQHGFHYYDFMGGEERYKSQLGSFHCQLVQVSLQRSRFKLRLEDVVRNARNRLRQESAEKLKERLKGRVK
jgi:CelD/BcsL family acetyltransferase involved in cellulose biosynthesis